MMAAIRLAREGKSITLVDSSLPEAKGKLGGFAKFSGAKFSLPPAGMGLASLLGSTDKLFHKIEEVIEVLGIAEHDQHFSIDRDAMESKSLGSETILRSYKSIVLTPTQIDDLIARLTEIIKNKCTIISGTVINISNRNDQWVTTIKANDASEISEIVATSIFYAAGRLASSVLKNAGAKEFPGKGLDLGVRVEFLNKGAINNLRALGPDAKIIRNACRTFCLNSPGEIYYYPYNGIKIPGGIVAESEIESANVGVLFRVEDKANGIKRVIEKYFEFEGEIESFQRHIRNGLPNLKHSDCLLALFDEKIISELQDFFAILGDLKLVDWSQSHRIHLPLIDWYWETFCESFSHKTTLKHIYALGDSAGYARGLLQAALSGWIASEEYLNDIAN